MDPKPKETRRFPGFSSRFRRSLSRYAEKAWIFVLIGTLAGSAPAVVMFFGVFPAILGTRPGQSDIISSPAIQLLATLIIMIVIAPLHAALGVAAADEARLLTALRRGFLLTFAWLATYTLASLTLLVPSLLLFPGAIMGAGFSVLLPVVVNEKSSGFAAMGRSADLVSGRLWKVILNLVFFVLLTSAVALPFTLIPRSTLSMLMGMLVSAALFTPLLFIFLQILYEDLRDSESGVPARKKSRYLHKILAAAGFALVALLSTAILRTL
jgi:hypothetical protein